MRTDLEPSINTLHSSSLPKEHFKLCWQSIFGGVVVTILTGLMMNLLGMSLGFATLTPDMESAKSLSSLGMGWMFVSGLVSMYIGGWIASRFSYCSNKTKGYWQGFIMAGLSMFILLYLATTSIGSLLNSGFSMIEQVVSTSGEVIGKSASGASETLGKLSDTSKKDMVDNAKNILPSSLSPLIDQIGYEADVLTDSVNNSIAENTPSASQTQSQIDEAKSKAEQFKKNVKPALHNFFESIGTDNYDQAKSDLIAAISQASGKSPQEVQDKVAAWQKSFEDAKNKAAQAAKDAALKTSAIISQISLIGFILILSSIIAAGLGGISGARVSSYRDQTVL